MKTYQRQIFYLYDPDGEKKEYGALQMETEDLFRECSRQQRVILFLLWKFIKADGELFCLQKNSREEK